jgi:hypothetical protein
MGGDCREHPKAQLISQRGALKETRDLPLASRILSENTGTAFKIRNNMASFARSLESTIVALHFIAK